MTAQQKELYDAVVNRQLRPFLIGRKTGPDVPEETETETNATSAPQTSASSPEPADAEEPASEPRRSRRSGVRRRDYAEKSDRQFFKDADAGTSTELTDRLGRRIGEGDVDDGKTVEEIGKEHRAKMATKSVNQLKLQNVVMQLRKVCNHVSLTPRSVA